MTTNDARPGAPLTNAERREQARLQAQQNRIAAQRKRRSQRVAAVTILALALTGLVTALVVTFLQQREGDAAKFPEARPTVGGVVLPRAADPVHGGVPVSAAGTGVAAEDGVTVHVFLDAMCPYCGIFDRVNGADLDELAQQEGVTVVYHPVAALDELSRGTAYSTRAANAAGLIADQDPEHFTAFLSALFAEGTQPQENTPGLSDDEIADVARSVGVDDDVVARFTEQGDQGRTFAGWAAAGMSQIPPNEEGKVGTPTVTIDGVRWTENFTVPGALRAAVEAARG